jgi:hypothetical protein
LELGQIEEVVGRRPRLRGRAREFGTGVDEVGGVEGAAAVVALVAAGVLEAAVGAGAFDVAVGQEAFGHRVEHRRRGVEEEVARSRRRRKKSCVTR